MQIRLFDTLGSSLSRIQTTSARAPTPTNFFTDSHVFSGARKLSLPLSRKLVLIINLRAPSSLTFPLHKRTKPFQFSQRGSMFVSYLRLVRLKAALLFLTSCIDASGFFTLPCDWLDTPLQIISIPSLLSPIHPPPIYQHPPSLTQSAN